MAKLSTEQMLYLLFAVAYSTDGTVKKGDVKGNLPADVKKKADQICEDLCQQKLLESLKASRLAVTELGKKALVANLQTTDYKFESAKGPKMLNALLSCFKLLSPETVVSSAAAEEMDFETFVEKFKKLYFQQRKEQQLRGVVAIVKKQLFRQFIEENAISETLLEKFFEKLKSQGEISVVAGREDDLINWIE
ncbi:hypothetical protein NG798_14605 [Ancylothrix sp. C2]|uniref:hypothetical protein n=1 Tax=Ancylothrix sp. D3o TaxID=2953691 RepID=UPI0021BB28E8|nr:hypothetical protein [Ancylothrix sp. D3o]MCT7951026.1 hypothetical protein [Ancylothrix sp. D3o]